MQTQETGARNVLIQTTIRVAEGEDKELLVVSDRGCQTITSVAPDIPTTQIISLLEYTPYSEIVSNSIKEYDLPKKNLIQFELTQPTTSKTSKAVMSGSDGALKGALKKASGSDTRSNQEFGEGEEAEGGGEDAGEAQTAEISEEEGTAEETRGLESHDDGSQVLLNFTTDASAAKKTKQDESCQTDLTVSPPILDDDAIANVCAQLGVQTSLTFPPNESLTEVTPELKKYLSHTKDYQALVIDGKIVPHAEVDEAKDAGKSEGETQDKAVSSKDNAVTQSPEVAKPPDAKPGDAKADDAKLADVTKSQDGQVYQFTVTEEEFEKIVQRILDNTVKNVYDFMAKIVDMYEQSKQGVDGAQPTPSPEVIANRNKAFEYIEKCLQGQIPADQVEIVDQPDGTKKFRIKNADVGEGEPRDVVVEEKLKIIWPKDDSKPDSADKEKPPEGAAADAAAPKAADQPAGEPPKEEAAATKGAEEAPKPAEPPKAPEAAAAPAAEPPKEGEAKPAEAVPEVPKPAAADQAEPPKEGEADVDKAKEVPKPESGEQKEPPKERESTAEEMKQAADLVQQIHKKELSPTLYSETNNPDGTKTYRLTLGGVNVEVLATADIIDQGKPDEAKTTAGAAGKSVKHLEEARQETVDLPPGKEPTEVPTTWQDAEKKVAEDEPPEDKKPRDDRPPIDEIGDTQCVKRMNDIDCECGKVHDGGAAPPLLTVGDNKVTLKFRVGGPKKIEKLVDRFKVKATISDTNACSANEKTIVVSFNVADADKLTPCTEGGPPCFKPECSECSSSSSSAASIVGPCARKRKNPKDADYCSCASERETCVCEGRKKNADICSCDSKAKLNALENKCCPCSATIPPKPEEPQQLTSTAGDIKPCPCSAPIPCKPEESQKLTSTPDDTKPCPLSAPIPSKPEESQKLASTPEDTKPCPLSAPIPSKPEEPQQLTTTPGDIKPCPCSAPIPCKPEESQKLTSTPDDTKPCPLSAPIPSKPEDSQKLASTPEDTKPCPLSAPIPSKPEEPQKLTSTPGDTKPCPCPAPIPSKPEEPPKLTSTPEDTKPCPLSAPIPSKPEEPQKVTTTAGNTKPCPCSAPIPPKPEEPQKITTTAGDTQPCPCSAPIPCKPGESQKDTATAGDTKPCPCSARIPSKPEEPQKVTATAGDTKPCPCSAKILSKPEEPQQVTATAGDTKPCPCSARIPSKPEEPQKVTATAGDTKPCPCSAPIPSKPEEPQKVTATAGDTKPCPCSAPIPCKPEEPQKPTVGDGVYCSCSILLPDKKEEPRYPTSTAGDGTTCPCPTPIPPKKEDTTCPCAAILAALDESRYSTSSAGDSTSYPSSSPISSREEDNTCPCAAVLAALEESRYSTSSAGDDPYCSVPKKEPFAMNTDLSCPCTEPMPVKKKPRYPTSRNAATCCSGTTPTPAKEQPQYPSSIDADTSCSCVIPALTKEEKPPYPNSTKADAPCPCSAPIPAKREKPRKPTSASAVAPCSALVPAKKQPQYPTSVDAETSCSCIIQPSTKEEKPPYPTSTKADAPCPCSAPIPAKRGKPRKSTSASAVAPCSALVPAKKQPQYPTSVDAETSCSCIIPPSTKEEKPPYPTSTKADAPCPCSAPIPAKRQKLRKSASANLVGSYPCSAIIPAKKQPQYPTSTEAAAPCPCSAPIPTKREKPQKPISSKAAAPCPCSAPIPAKEEPRYPTSSNVDTSCSCLVPCGPECLKPCGPECKVMNREKITTAVCQALKEKLPAKREEPRKPISSKAAAPCPCSAPIPDKREEPRKPISSKAAAPCPCSAPIPDKREEPRKPISSKAAAPCPCSAPILAKEEPRYPTSSNVDTSCSCLVPCGPECLKPCGPECKVMNREKITTAVCQALKEKLPAKREELRKPSSGKAAAPCPCSAPIPDKREEPRKPISSKAAAPCPCSAPIPAKREKPRKPISSKAAAPCPCSAPIQAKEEPRYPTSSNVDTSCSCLVPCGPECLNPCGPECKVMNRAKITTALKEKLTESQPAKKVCLCGKPHSTNCVSGATSLGDGPQIGSDETSVSQATSLPKISEKSVQKVMDCLKQQNFKDPSLLERHLRGLQPLLKQMEGISMQSFQSGSISQPKCVCVSSVQVIYKKADDTKSKGTCANLREKYKPPPPILPVNGKPNKACHCDLTYGGDTARDTTPLYQEEGEYQETYYDTEEFHKPSVKGITSLPDVVNETDRCGKRSELPWLKMALPPPGSFTIKEQPKKPCDCQRKVKTRTMDRIVGTCVCPDDQKMKPEEVPCRCKAHKLPVSDDDTCFCKDGDGQPRLPKFPCTCKPPPEPIPTKKESPPKVQAMPEPPKDTKRPAFDDVTCPCRRSLGPCPDLKPTPLLYDDAAETTNEDYMNPLYKLFPDESESPCGLSTEIEWGDYTLPTNVKLKSGERKKKRACPSTCGMGTSVSKTPQSNRQTQASPPKLYTRPAQSEPVITEDASTDKFTPEPNMIGLQLVFSGYTEIVSTLISVEEAAKDQQTVSKFSTISDVTRTVKRMDSKFVKTTLPGGEQAGPGYGIVPTVGSGTFVVGGDGPQDDTMPQVPDKQSDFVKMISYEPTADNQPPPPRGATPRPQGAGLMIITASTQRTRANMIIRTDGQTDGMNQNDVLGADTQETGTKYDTSEYKGRKKRRKPIVEEVPSDIGPQKPAQKSICCGDTVQEPIVQEVNSQDSDSSCGPNAPCVKIVELPDSPSVKSSSVCCGDTIQKPIKQKPIKQKPTKQKPIKQKPIKQEPIVQEVISQDSDSSCDPNSPCVKNAKLPKRKIKDASICCGDTIQKPIKQKPIKQKPIVQEVISQDSDSSCDPNSPCVKNAKLPKRKIKDASICCGDTIQKPIKQKPIVEEVISQDSESSCDPNAPCAKITEIPESPSTESSSVCCGDTKQKGIKQKIVPENSDSSCDPNAPCGKIPKKYKRPSKETRDVGIGCGQIECQGGGKRKESIDSDSVCGPDAPCAKIPKVPCGKSPCITPESDSVCGPNAPCAKTPKVPCGKSPCTVPESGNTSDSVCGPDAPCGKAPGVPCGKSSNIPEPDKKSDSVCGPGGPCGKSTSAKSPSTSESDKTSDSVCGPNATCKSVTTKSRSTPEPDKVSDSVCGPNAPCAKIPKVPCDKVCIMSASNRTSDSVCGPNAPCAQVPKVPCVKSPCTTPDKTSDSVCGPSAPCKPSSTRDIGTGCGQNECKEIVPYTQKSTDDEIGPLAIVPYTKNSTDDEIDPLTIVPYKSPSTQSPSDESRDVGVCCGKIKCKRHSRKMISAGEEIVPEESANVDATCGSNAPCGIVSEVPDVKSPSSQSPSSQSPSLPESNESPDKPDKETRDIGVSCGKSKCPRNKPEETTDEEIVPPESVPPESVPPDAVLECGLTAPCPFRPKISKSPSVEIPSTESDTAPDEPADPVMATETRDIGISCGKSKCPRNKPEETADEEIVPPESVPPDAVLECGLTAPCPFRPKISKSPSTKSPSSKSPSTKSPSTESDTAPDEVAAPVMAKATRDIGTSCGKSECKRGRRQKESADEELVPPETGSQEAVPPDTILECGRGTPCPRKSKIPKSPSTKSSSTSGTNDSLDKDAAPAIGKKGRDVGVSCGKSECKRSKRQKESTIEKIDPSESVSSEEAVSSDAILECGRGAPCPPRPKISKVPSTKSSSTSGTDDSLSKVPAPAIGKDTKDVGRTCGRSECKKTKRPKKSTDEEIVPPKSVSPKVGPQEAVPSDATIICGRDVPCPQKPKISKSPSTKSSSTSEADESLNKVAVPAVGKDTKDVRRTCGRSECKTSKRPKKSTDEEVIPKKSVSPEVGPQAVPSDATMICGRDVPCPRKPKISKSPSTKSSSTSEADDSLNKVAAPSVGKDTKDVRRTCGRSECKTSKKPKKSTDEETVPPKSVSPKVGPQEAVPSDATIICGRDVPCPRKPKISKSPSTKSSSTSEADDSLNNVAAPAVGKDTKDVRRTCGRSECKTNKRPKKSPDEEIVPPKSVFPKVSPQEAVTSDATLTCGRGAPCSRKSKISKSPSTKSSSTSETDDSLDKVAAPAIAKETRDVGVCCGKGEYKKSKKQKESKGEKIVPPKIVPKEAVAPASCLCAKSAKISKSPKSPSILSSDSAQKAAAEQKDSTASSPTESEYSLAKLASPIMATIKTVEKEMKPLYDTLNELRAKIQSMDIPELDNWNEKASCSNCCKAPYNDTKQISLVIPQVSGPFKTRQKQQRKQMPKECVCLEVVNDDYGPRSMKDIVDETMGLDKIVKQNITLKPVHIDNFDTYGNYKDYKKVIERTMALDRMIRQEFKTTNHNKNTQSDTSIKSATKEHKNDVFKCKGFNTNIGVCASSGDKQNVGRKIQSPAVNVSMGSQGCSNLCNYFPYMMDWFYHNMYNPYVCPYYYPEYMYDCSQPRTVVYKAPKKVCKKKYSSESSTTSTCKSHCSFTSSYSNSATSETATYPTTKFGESSDMVESLSNDEDDKDVGFEFKLPIAKHGSILKATDCLEARISKTMKQEYKITLKAPYGGNDVASKAEVSSSSST